MVTVAVAPSKTGHWLVHVISAYVLEKIPSRLLWVVLPNVLEY